MLAKDLKEILYLQKRLDIKHRKRWDPRLEQTKTHKDPIVDDAPPLVLLRSTGMQPSPLLQSEIWFVRPKETRASSERVGMQADWQALVKDPGQLSFCSSKLRRAGIIARQVT